MNIGKRLTAALLMCAAIASPEPADPKRDLSALRDFDFLMGPWVAHHRQLKARLVGSSEWIEFDGRVLQRPLMDGFSNSGDNVFRLPGGDYRGTSLRFYDARSGEWAVWWLDGRNPSAGLGTPIKGRFENGVGHFYSDDTLSGKPIRVRVTWTKPTPTTARWEQAYSPDGGKTWETNWITDFARPSAEEAKQFETTSVDAKDPDGVNAFDSHAGKWTVRHRQLKDRLAGSTEWIDFGGTQEFWPVLNGAGNLDTNFFPKPSDSYSGVTLRAFDPKTRQWAIWWLDGRNPPGVLDPPMKGRFENGVGLFYADETFRGKPIRVRFIWSNMSERRDTGSRPSRPMVARRGRRTGSVTSCAKVER